MKKENPTLFRPCLEFVRNLSREEETEGYSRQQKALQQWFIRKETHRVWGAPISSVLLKHHRQEGDKREWRLGHKPEPTLRGTGFHSVGQEATRNMSEQENKVRFIFSDNQMGKRFEGEQSLVLTGERTRSKETHYWAMALFLKNGGLTWISS